jgi:tetratricopeptide (TPR) repeat protein
MPQTPAEPDLQAEPQPEPSPPTPITVPPADQARILALYERGQYLKAHTAATAFGPLKDWAGTDAQVLAGRMAGNLGAPRLAAWLHRRAWRGAPEHPQAIGYYARQRLASRGPLAAWFFAARFAGYGDLPGATPGLHADWLSILAEIAAQLRDFHRADQHIAAALKLAPDDPWLHVAQASVFEAEDRYEDALAAAEQSLALRPWFRPAVQTKAHLLELRDRAGEARSLLRAAREQIESGGVVWQLADLEIEGGDPQVGRALLDMDLPALYPLMEERLRRALDEQRADAAYRCGDIAAAIAFGERSGSPFHARVSSNLQAAGPEARRVLLPVGYVRQHHVTCAPATLSAISRYWSMPADHLEIAEEICYDGTPAQSERRWAEQAGWLVREFSVDAASAIALIDRGVPFTLTTTSADAGHLQAVIGYDTLRGSLLIRDPFYSSLGELLMDEGLARLADFGPRGMALVPAAEAHRLDGLDLPDAGRYDDLYALNVALQVHDRERAQQAYEHLRSGAAEHRLTLIARFTLASYDGDEMARLEAVEALLGKYPESETLRVWQLGSLDGLERREARLDALRTLSRRPGGHPIFKVLHAATLMPDSREHLRAERLLCRAIRDRPDSAWAYHLLGHLSLGDGEGDAARGLSLLRFATCLEDKDEGYAASYFSSASQAGQQRQAFGLLRDRVQRFGRQSSQPARTLHWALEQADRVDEAFDLLEDALDRHPEDGGLLCYAADVFARFGDLDRADALQAAARGRVARSVWLRSAAGLAGYRGDAAAASRHWQAIVATEPLATDAQAALVRTLADSAGPEAALAHLRETCQRFAHHLPLHALWVSWLRDGDTRETEAVLRHILGTINPRDAWTLRELALCLAEQNRLDEARRQAELACEIDPRSAVGTGILGHVHRLAGDRAAAADRFRAAIRRSADYEPAIFGLMGVSDSPAAQWKALEDLRAELQRQPGIGAGVLAYRQVAQAVLAPERLLEVLQALHAARPEIWQTWSALLMQHLELDREGAAKVLAVGMTERFPYMPRAWLDRAQLHQALGEREDAIRCLERALSISPGWGWAARELAGLHWSFRDDLDAARAVLERAIRYVPADPENHVALARVLWAQSEPATAIERLSQAIRLAPGPVEPWDLLIDWCGSQGEAAGVPLALARDITQRRPFDAAGWLHLARILGDDVDMAERLAAIDRAIALDPRDVNAHDRRAVLLVEAGRFDEALAACAPPALGDRLPHTLAGRAAWVMACQGRLEDAVRHMRAVVDAEPDYFWGWGELSEWTEVLGDTAGMLEAAERLTGLAPGNPYVLGTLGDALRLSGDATGAREAYQRAILVEPEYHYAGIVLCAMEIDAGDLDAAEEAVRLLAAGNASPMVTVGYQAMLDARRGRREAALEGMRRLAVDPDVATNNFYLRRACEAINDAGWGQPLLDLFDEVARTNASLPPNLGPLWLHLAAEEQGWDAAAAVVDRLRLQGRIARQASVVFMKLLRDAETQAGNARLRAYLREEAAWLAEDPWTWGHAAWAYTTLGDSQACIDWTDDWQAHPGVQPWMLANRLHSLLDLGRDDEARALSLEALAIEEVPADDPGLPLHHAWLAFDAALAGRVAAARESLAAVGTPITNPDVTLQVEMASALIDAARVEAGELPKSTLAAARRRVEAAAKAHPSLSAPTERWLRRLHERCVQRLDRAQGGLRGWLRGGRG